jgi:hypothetical protein
MRRRKLLAVIVGLTVVVAAGAVVLRPLPQPTVRVTQEKNDRIVNDRMTTVAEIESLLGGPPGDYTTQPADEPSVSPWSGDRIVAWYTDDGHVIVQADADGGVEGVCFMPPKKPSPGQHAAVAG